MRKIFFVLSLIICIAISTVACNNDSNIKERNEIVITEEDSLTLDAYKDEDVRVNTEPFNNLDSEDIKEVTVELMPPQDEFELKGDEIDKLVKILNKITVYEIDDSYSEYSGQAITITITKNNGTQINIIELTPFIVIDGVGYKSEYEPCEELNSFANSLFTE